MNAPANLTEGQLVPAPDYKPLSGRITVIFYNRSLDGKPYGLLDFGYPAGRSVSYLNDEGHLYMRDHFAVWGAEGLIHDGPVLDALGNPILTYAEKKAASSHMRSTIGMV